MGDTITISSLETEQLVLGAMLVAKRDCTIACESLTKKHFYDPKHCLIFSTLFQFNQENRPTDSHLIAKQLEKEGKLKEIGGVQYLVDLAHLVGGGIYVEEYIKILKDLWAKRASIDEIEKFHSSLDKVSSVTEWIDRHAKTLRNISQESFNASSISFNHISKGIGAAGYLKSRKRRLEYFRKNKMPFLDGVATGYPDLDRLLGGFGNSNFIVLAGRPGMGKTAIALNFVRHVANSNPVGFISLEMTSEQLYERMISMETRIAGDKIREGRLSDEEWAKLIQIEPNVASLPIYLHEGSHNLNDLISKVRAMKEQQGICLLVIDYLQLINASGETRFLEIANITRDLKNLSVELHIPILCLAQLSRKVEDRPGHRPLLSDLRENGCIEQDADSVLFIVRQDYYDEHNRPGEADLIVAKNRHGKTGETVFYFNKDAAKFESFENAKNDFDLF